MPHEFEIDQNPHREEQVTVQVLERQLQGDLVIHWDKPRQWIGLYPASANALAHEMAVRVGNLMKPWDGEHPVHIEVRARRDQYSDIVMQFQKPLQEIELAPTQALQLAAALAQAIS